MCDNITETNLLTATIFVVITIQTVKLTHSSSNISTVTCPLQPVYLCQCHTHRHTKKKKKKKRVKKTAHLLTSSLLTINEAFVGTNKLTDTFTKAATAYMINRANTIASNLCIDFSYNFKVYICQPLSNSLHYAYDILEAPRNLSKFEKHNALIYLLVNIYFSLILFSKNSFQQI